MYFFFIMVFNKYSCLFLFIVDAEEEGVSYAAHTKMHQK